MRWRELVREYPEHPDGDATIFDQVKKQIQGFLTFPSHDGRLVQDYSRCIEFIANRGGIGRIGKPTDRPTCFDKRQLTFYIRTMIEGFKTQGPAELIRTGRRPQD